MSVVYKNFQLVRDTDNICWIYFDKENSSANTLNAEVLGEFNSILDGIDADKAIKGVVITSAKSSGFIAGADIEQFTQFVDKTEALEKVAQGQQIFDKLEKLSVPTIALIEGFCLGGGFELALACRYRIVKDCPKTRLGLPEVMLGIQPGWGGTVRLCRLIGAKEGLNLILSGTTVSASAAAKLGIADAAVPKRHLETAARTYILTKPPKPKPGRLQSLTNNALIRPILAKLVHKTVAQKVRADHYPAPYRIIENWRKYGVSQHAYKVEVESICDLFFTETSKNLVRIFFLQERMKKLAQGVDFKPKHVHVIGAGTMGGDIAAWCALRGMNVTLQDREPKFIAPAIKRAHELFTKKLKKPRLVQEAMDRLLPDTEGRGVYQADIAIEAIYENLAAKQELFKDLELKMRPDAILATNTSSIPLDDINSVMQNPERLVGIHFFNPVAMMQLVEVVKGNKTSPDILQKAVAFVRAIDRYPLPVRSNPGFLVNRVLMPYLLESINLYKEGVPGPVIDQAAVEFGMPMGPIELADTVGLDVCLSVAKNLTHYYGGEVPANLVQLVEQGKLGKKSGKGFYEFNAKGKPIKPKASNSSKLNNETIAKRLIYRMLNEAVACLHEGVVEDADLLDAGMIFGTGFAPFRGGPMQYSRSQGVEKIMTELQSFATQYGDRYKPDAGWMDLNRE